MSAKGFRFSLIILWAASFVACSPDVSPSPSSFFQSETSTTSAIISGDLEKDPYLGRALTVVQISGGAYCTGIYIGGHKVLTSAHCLMNQAQSSVLQEAISVIFYKNAPAHPSLESELPFSQRCGIRQQHLPRPFDSRDNWQGDIAVLLLNPSCPLKDRDFLEWRSVPAATSDWWVSGFGSTDLSRLNPFPSRLKTLKLNHFEPLNSREQIVDLYNQIERDYGPSVDKQEWVDSFYRKVQSHSHFCFLSRNGASPFFGDSGGPLYTRSGSRFYLLGVFSHIYLLKNPKRVHSFCFQNIAPYRHWIYSRGKN